MCVRDRAEEEGWSALEVCVIYRTCIRQAHVKVIIKNVLCYRLLFG